MIVAVFVVRHGVDVMVPTIRLASVPTTVCGMRVDFFLAVNSVPRPVAAAGGVEESDDDEDDDEKRERRGWDR